MLIPILKNEGVNDSERHLSKLLKDTFLSLWSYMGPYSDEGRTKNKQGKEICDALVVFGNKVIIFSDKEIKFNREKPPLVAWKRWYRKSVSDSVRQLHAAESWIKKNPQKVFLDNFCTVPFPLDLKNQNLEIHLVALTKNTLEPAKEYFDKFAKGSTGTFAHFYTLSEEEILEQPFFLCDVSPNKTFVHIFDEFLIDLLINELGTISDFLKYLKVKENLIRKYGLIVSHGEEDLLGYYLSKENIRNGSTRYFKYPKRKNEEQTFIIKEGYWKSFIHSEDYHLHQILKEYSIYWSKLSSRLSDSIVSAKVGDSINYPLEAHEMAIRSLASENNISRAYLAQAFLGKFEYVQSGRCSARVVQSPFNNKKIYVFLFLPFINNESTEEYTQRRTEMAFQYAICTKYRISSLHYITIIITQPKCSLIRSEAVYYYDYTKDLTHKEKIKASRIIKYAGILKEFTDYSEPFKDHDAKLKIKMSRNGLCHCGSRKKYKKCCLLLDELTGSRYT